MESFVLAETVKYFYLLFDPDADGIRDDLGTSINFLATATRGCKIDVFTDGTMWYAHGLGSTAQSFGST